MLYTDILIILVFKLCISVIIDCLKPNSIIYPGRRQVWS